MSFTESEVEEAALHWFSELGYSIAYGPDLLADGTHPSAMSARRFWRRGYVRLSRD